MSNITTSNGFKAGDLVFIGTPAPLTEKVVWRIVSLYQATADKSYAVLRSGMTERTATVDVERLTRFTQRLTEPYRD